MNAVGHGTNGYLGLRPTRKQRLKDVPAHLSMELTDPIDLRAAVQCKVGHIEKLRRISSVLPSQGKQALHRDCEFVLRIVGEVFTHKPGVKSIKSSRYRRVSCEHVAGPNDRERNVKRNTMVFHVAARPFKYRKRRVTFVQMAYLWV